MCDVINLENEINSNLNLVGGKSKNLYELKSLNLNVPNGFTITTTAYKKFLKHNEIDKLIENTKDKFKNGEIKLSKFAEIIEKSFNKSEMPEILNKQISKIYKKMNFYRVAVRSSSILEDLDNSSFAGQQETFLNVSDLRTLTEKIIACWKSLWSERALIYRYKAKFNIAETQMAIVIQEMVDSQVSGVLFTRNPINNNLEILINSIFGLGELLASGKVDPDTYIFNYETEKLIDLTIGNQDKVMLYKEKVGNVIEKLDSSLKLESSLKKKQIQKLISEAKKIEKHYNNLPQDIEWSIKDDRIYFLQTRAITTLMKESYI